MKALTTEIFESLTDPSFLLDDSGELLWANKAYFSLLEQIEPLSTSTASEEATLTCRDLFSPAALQDALKTEHASVFPVQLNLRNIGPSSFSASCLALDGGGPGSEMVLMTLRNRPVRLEHTASDDLLLITHDLKNPIGAVFGYADVVLDTNLGDGLSEEQRKVIRQIRHTAERAIGLIQNYEQLLRLGVETSESPRVMDLNESVQRVLEPEWREEPGGPTLACVLASTPLPICLHQSHLERILTNLIGNARKYTPDGHSVKIKTYCEEPKNPKGERVVFEIWNSGTYIPLEEQGKIFEKNQRGTSSNGISGNGLGLFIAKELATNSGGELKVESDPEDGTTFQFVMPKAEGIA